MRIDFSQVIKSIYGEPLKDGPDEGEKKAPDLTLGRACVGALMAAYRDETPTGQEKAKRHALAMLIVSNDSPIELKVEQIAQLKELVGKAYGPIVVGPAYEMLENGASKGKDG